MRETKGAGFDLWAAMWRLAHPASITDWLELVGVAAFAVIGGLFVAALTAARRGAGRNLAAAREDAARGRVRRLTPDPCRPAVSSDAGSLPTPSEDSHDTQTRHVIRTVVAAIALLGVPGAAGSRPAAGAAPGATSPSSNRRPRRRRS